MSSPDKNFYYLYFKFPHKDINIYKGEEMVDIFICKNIHVFFLLPGLGLLLKRFDLDCGYENKNEYTV